MHIGDPEGLFTVRANIDVVSLVIVIFEDVTLPSLLTVNLLANDVFFTTRGKAVVEILESMRHDDPTAAHAIPPVGSIVHMTLADEFFYC